MSLTHARTHAHTHTHTHTDTRICIDTQTHREGGSGIDDVIIKRPRKDNICDVTFNQRRNDINHTINRRQTGDLRN